MVEIIGPMEDSVACMSVSTVIIPIFSHYLSAGQTIKIPRTLPGKPGAGFYIFPFLYTQRCDMRDLYLFGAQGMDEEDDEPGDEDDFDEDWEDEEEE